MSTDLIVTLDSISVEPSPGGDNVALKVILSTELGDATALDLVLKVVEAIVRMRGDDL